MNLGEFIFVCNENSYDVDVYDDYDERLGCAYCGDECISLTEEGLKEFKDALALEVEWTDGNPTCIVKIPTDKGDDESERLAELAKRLILALAGYCPSSKYDLWFKEDFEY